MNSFLSLQGPPEVRFLHVGCCRPGADYEKGGGGGSMDPKTVARNNGFYGCRKRQRFCFSLTAEGEFLFSPHVLILKMLTFFRGFQLCQRHVKEFLPICFPFQLSLPALSARDRAPVIT